MPSSTFPRFPRFTEKKGECLWKAEILLQEECLEMVHAKTIGDR